MSVSSSGKRSNTPNDRLSDNRGSAVKGADKQDGSGKGKRPLSKRLVESNPSQDRRSREATKAEQLTTKLFKMVDPAYGVDVSRSVIELDVALAEAQLDGPRTSGVQWLADSMGKQAASMNGRQLSVLSDEVTAFLRSARPSKVSEAVKLLALTLDSELLFRGVQALAEQNVFIGGKHPSKKDDLIPAQCIQVAKLAGQAAVLKADATLYTGAESGAVPGSRFTHKALAVIVEQARAIQEDGRRSPNKVTYGNAALSSGPSPIAEGGEHGFVKKAPAREKRADREAREAMAAAKLKEQTAMEVKLNADVQKLCDAIAAHDETVALDCAVHFQVGLTSLAMHRGMEDGHRIDLQGDFLLRVTGSLALSDLRTLEDALRALLSKNLSVPTRELLTHLSFSVRSQVLRVRVQELARDGVHIATNAMPDFNKLTYVQLQELADVSKLASDLKGDMAPYVNTSTTMVSGVGLLKSRLDTLEAQLAPYPEAKAKRNVNDVAKTLDLRTTRLIQALKDDDVGAIQKTNQLIAISLVYGRTRDASGVNAMWHKCLETSTTQLSSAELTALCAVLDRHLTYPNAPEQRLQLLQLATAFRSELFFRRIGELADAGLEFDAADGPDFNLLTAAAQQEIPGLLGLAHALTHAPFAECGFLSDADKRYVQDLSAKLKLFQSTPTDLTRPGSMDITRRSTSIADLLLDDDDDDDANLPGVKTEAADVRFSANLLEQDGDIQKIVLGKASRDLALAMLTYDDSRFAEAMDSIHSVVDSTSPPVADALVCDALWESLEDVELATIEMLQEEAEQRLVAATAPDAVLAQLTVVLSARRVIDQGRELDAVMLGGRASLGAPAHGAQASRLLDIAQKVQQSLQNRPTMLTDAVRSQFDMHVFQLQDMVDVLAESGVAEIQPGAERVVPDRSSVRRSVYAEPNTPVSESDLSRRMSNPLDVPNVQRRSVRKSDALPLAGQHVRVEQTTTHLTVENPMPTTAASVSTSGAKPTRASTRISTRASKLISTSTPSRRAQKPVSAAELSVRAQVHRFIEAVQAPGAFDGNLLQDVGAEMYRIEATPQARAKFIREAFELQGLDSLVKLSDATVQLRSSFINDNSPLGKLVFTIHTALGVTIFFKWIDNIAMDGVDIGVSLEAGAPDFTKMSKPQADLLPRIRELVSTVCNRRAVETHVLSPVELEDVEELFARINAYSTLDSYEDENDILRSVSSWADTKLSGLR